MWVGCLNKKRTCAVFIKAGAVLNIIARKAHFLILRSRIFCDVKNGKSHVNGFYRSSVRTFAGIPRTNIIHYQRLLSAKLACSLRKLYSKKTGQARKIETSSLKREDNMDLNKHPNANVAHIIQRHEDDIEAVKKRTATLERVTIGSLYLAVYFLVKKTLKK